MSTRKADLISPAGFFMPSLPVGAGSHCGLTQSAERNLRVSPRRPSRWNVAKAKSSHIPYVKLYMLALLAFSSCSAEPRPAFAETEVWEATGYCPCIACCGKSDGVTASGLKATPGRTAAVNSLPFGTRLNINGHSYIVQDRGSVSHFGSRLHPKKRVDIFFGTHGEALRFGRRKVSVEVIG